MISESMVLEMHQTLQEVVIEKQMAVDCQHASPKRAMPRPIAIQLYERRPTEETPHAMLMRRREPSSFSTKMVEISLQGVLPSSTIEILPVDSLRPAGFSHWGGLNLASLEVVEDWRLQESVPLLYSAHALARVRSCPNLQTTASMFTRKRDSERVLEQLDLLDDVCWHGLELVLIQSDDHFSAPLHGWPPEAFPLLL